MGRQSCPQHPGVALHLVARGEGAARLGFYGRLLDASRALDCAVHAYALLGTHLHLLATPSRRGGGSELLRLLGAGEVDGTPVAAARQLLACMRYIELNPVRAGLVALPGDYRWSSWGANALGRDDALVTPHACYYALGRTPQLRRAAWRARTRAPR